MSQTIVFATGNHGKVKSFQRELEPMGFEVEQHDLDLMEPQLDSVVEIAQFKAREAHKIVGGPVVVQDTGFSISALNGFPGPYSKYAQETLGAEGFVKLLEGGEHRESYFHGVIVYIDENGEMHTFEEKGPYGRIAQEVDPSPLKPEAWSCLWKVYIPTHADKTLNAMSDAEMAEWYDTHRGESNFKRFAAFLAQSRNSTPQKKRRFAP